VSAERRAAAFLAALLLACARPPVAGNVAAVTIAPLADLVARLAGERWQVRTIVPPGISPHVFDPKPRDVRAFADARLVVSVGAGYDDWVSRCVAAAASKAFLHDAGATVGVVAEEGGHDQHAHGELGHDPHWWLSPVLAARALPPLAARLSELDPPGREGYAARALELTAVLERLDAELGRTLSSVRGRPFVTAHNAWSYLAERYGLVVAGSIEPVPGREPSPKDLLRLVASARSRNLTAVFTEPQFPTGAARVIAGDAGLKLEELDPFGGVPGRLHYEDMMRFNARSLLEGLS